MPQAHLHWGAEALWQQLAPLLPGLSVEVVASIGSTNSELLARAQADARHHRHGDRQGDRHGDARPKAPGTAPDHSAPFGRRGSDTQPCLLVAEHQTQGRGRQGKDWQSAVGASLTFSLALPLQPADWSGLSLAVGLALAEALDPADGGAAEPRVVLKWPNDLLLRDARGLGRKLGGILIETVQVGHRRLAVIGIGLNVLPLSPPPGVTLAWGHAHLQALWPGITAPGALQRVAGPLVRGLLDFERQGFAPLRGRYERRDVLRGQAVTTTLPALPGGVADGVDDSGVLWLRTADGARHAVASGEVSIRPAPAAG